MFVIVDRVDDARIRGYFLIPGKRGGPPNRAYVWADHGHYHRIGPAMWTVDVLNERE